MASAYSNVTNPTVEGQALKRQLSTVLMNNIVQEMIQSDGKGVTEEHSTDTNALQIRVVRENPLTQSARTIGADAFNGTDQGYFSSQTPEQPTSTQYGLNINIAYDTPIDIPSNMTDMFPLDIVNKTLRNLSQAIAKNVNASTTAEQLTKYFNAIKDTTISDTTVTYDSGTDEFLDKFWDASAVLDEGDETNGVDTFPLTSRIFIVRGAGKSALLKFSGAVLEVGNWQAQQMLEVGSVSYNEVSNTNMDGFLGVINQANVHFQSNAVWNLAKNYMADASGTKLTANVHNVTTDQVIGYIASKEGTGRAIAFDSVVKTIDSPQGQGIRLQPKYRWGHETWFPGSIVAIVSTTFTLADATYPWVATNQVLAPGSSA